jgi:isoamylase
MSQKVLDRYRPTQLSPEILADLTVVQGRPYPLGPVVNGEGVRFSVVSRFAARVWICLYRDVADLEPIWEYEYDAKRHRTGDVWSIFVQGLSQGIYYKYRMAGEFDPKSGHYFDERIYLLDPRAKAFVGNVYDGTIKSVTVLEAVDHPCDTRPRIPMSETVIYEAHVRGLTRDPSSGVKHPGTYRGLIEKLPYLKELGITAIELLPVQEMGETRLGRCSLTGAGELNNYWGYSSIGFFAPTGQYGCSARAWEHVDEFREMVEAVHDAGMEVILDVVFNHTSEGDERGPNLCFRGMNNAIFYLLDEKGRYLNYSGCGNTVNCNHPWVRDFILDCLRYWVSVMHVDGFRFDLASILGRDQNGVVIENPPLVERIAEDPVLRDVKLIAEAWDAGGAYQVGSFGDVRWAEWNGRYRDDVRRYWRGDGGTRGAFASRLMGSADVYQGAGRTPSHSINFITCHDGFTLRDVVSYSRKHNWDNGEGNRDGSDDNLSINCGVEGETDAQWVKALRLRMQKNYLATLFLSLGVPMLLGGDEFGRTQGGNNNAYCQDNEVSWFDWGLLEKNKELFEFTKAMVAFRKAQPALTRVLYFESDTDDVHWFGTDGQAIDWSGPGTLLAYKIGAGLNGGNALFVAFNNSEQAASFTIPQGQWEVCINTAEGTNFDIAVPDTTTPESVTGDIETGSRSVVVLRQSAVG